MNDENNFDSTRIVISFNETIDAYENFLDYLDEEHPSFYDEYPEAVEMYRDFIYEFLLFNVNYLAEELNLEYLKRQQENQQLLLVKELLDNLIKELSEKLLKEENKKPKTLLKKILNFIKRKNT